MKPVKITNRNIMFTEPMTDEYDLNLGLILGVKNNYVIDTGLGSGSVKPILEYIGDDKKPIIVINTHCHWDHMWGNHVFDKSLIISHRLCRESADKHWDEAVKINASRIDGEVIKCLPNMVFEGSLHFPDDGIYIFHAPGHTDNCIAVYDEIEKVLYAGDSIGDTDEEIVPWIDTNPDTFSKGVIEAYKKLDFDFCITGHNRPLKKEVLSRMEAALADAWKKQNETR